MASMTDVIFLLLIFFMLTSTLVAPNALNLKLPGTSRAQTISPSRTDDVRITTDGSYFFNGRRIDQATLESQLADRAAGSATQYTITISPDNEAPVEAVVSVMDMAMRFEINGILTAEE